MDQADIYITTKGLWSWNNYIHQPLVKSYPDMKIPQQFQPFVLEGKEGSNSPGGQTLIKGMLVPSIGSENPAKDFGVRK